MIFSERTSNEMHVRAARRQGESSLTMSAERVEHDVCLESCQRCIASTDGCRDAGSSSPPTSVKPRTNHLTLRLPGWSTSVLHPHVPTAQVFLLYWLFLFWIRWSASVCKATFFGLKITQMTLYVLFRRLVHLETYILSSLTHLPR